MPPQLCTLLKPGRNPEVGSSSIKLSSHRICLEHSSSFVFFLYERVLDLSDPLLFLTNNLHNLHSMLFIRVFYILIFTYFLPIISFYCRRTCSRGFQWKIRCWVDEAFPCLLWHWRRNYYYLIQVREAIYTAIIFRWQKNMWLSSSSQI